MVMRRPEVRALSTWCEDNNPSLYVNKNMEIMDYRKEQRDHAHIHISGQEVERIQRLQALSWSLHIDTVLRGASTS